LLGTTGRQFGLKARNISLSARAEVPNISLSDRAEARKTTAQLNPPQRVMPWVEITKDHRPVRARQTPSPETQLDRLPKPIPEKMISNFAGDSIASE
jgi:hypothetical protein